MQVKNKPIFIFLIITYAIGYFFFCIFGGINSGAEAIGDSALGLMFLMLSNVPFGVRNLSMNAFLWTIISLILTLFICWQFSYESKQKLNRTVLLSELLNILLIVVSGGLCEGITTGFSSFSFVLSVLPVLIVLAMVLVAIGMTAVIQIKQGHTGYEYYQDILTREEYDKLIQKWKKK